MVNKTEFLDTLDIAGTNYQYYSLAKVASKFGENLHSLPKTQKILLENIVRRLGDTTSEADVSAFADWLAAAGHNNYDLSYLPSRVLMQDFTGVPAVVDLAAMRDAMLALGGKPEQINPECPVDLVIDHSIQVDESGHASAMQANINQEMLRNRERYKFLKWGQASFDNFRVVPPGTGICHQVNIEHLATVVTESSGFLYPDTLVGTDSHTTMVNGLGVLGWGVGGIEAEAVMLGLPISIKMPSVVGVRLVGSLNKVATATDMVLSITELLRAHGVVGKFVEFYGPGLASLSLADRATLANMAPEYGATCGFAPVDAETITYMRLTGRSEEQCALVAAYAKAQGLWADLDPVFSESVAFDLSKVEPCVAGPKRPQDKVYLSDIVKQTKSPNVYDESKVQDGDVVIAAITSCTNTSNPKVMIAAGLLAKAAVAKGLVAKPWVKCSLAPGSKVVVNYLEKLGLLEPLAAIGFHVVGFGCTTCIGNSGPLSEEVTQAILQKNLQVCGVLSGNRNFEGRIHPLVRDNWLASPPLVVAFALAGRASLDLGEQPLGVSATGEPVMLQDIWPTSEDLQLALSAVESNMFTKGYTDVFTGDSSWRSLPVTASETYAWQTNSTYVRKPSFFEGMSTDLPKLLDIKDAKILAILGDSVTTDHISPAGVIQPDSPAGNYLRAAGIEPESFNSYGSRRGNHEVMMRGTFANIRIKNQMANGLEGGYTLHVPSDEVKTIYDAAESYDCPLVVFAGAEYGTGSSRDWAAKGTLLLGVKCVIAQSFERIHRSNLIGMGVLPCQIEDFDLTALTGKETVSIIGLAKLKTAAKLELVIVSPDGFKKSYQLLVRLDTEKELEYYLHGGILQYVLRKKLET